MLQKALGVRGAYEEALASFAKAGRAGWSALPFFRAGAAQRLGVALDTRVAAGASVLPPADDLLNALILTPLDAVSVVVLGQDPYPTQGDAHGLAFSVSDMRGSSSSVPRSLPRSLGNIFKELHADLGVCGPKNGNLTPWAQQGVLLLNTCLTVEAGSAGSHRKLGWQSLTDEMILSVSNHQKNVVFILWGADAQTKRSLIDETKHCVLASVHPSPLSARRGFFGSKPFSQTNRWLCGKGLPAIDWGAA